MAIEQSFDRFPVFIRRPYDFTLKKADVRMESWSVVNCMVELKGSNAAFRQIYIKRAVVADAKRIGCLDSLEVIQHHVSAVKLATKADLREANRLMRQEQSREGKEAVLFNKNLGDLGINSMDKID